MASSVGRVIFCRPTKGHDKSVWLAGAWDFCLVSKGSMNPQRVLAYISAFVGLGVILIVWFVNKSRPTEEPRPAIQQSGESR